MTDTLIPEWVKKIEEQDKRRSIEAQSAALREALTDKTVQAEGPVFWKDLLREIQITADSLIRIGLRGIVSDIGNPDIEQGCQVSIGGIFNTNFSTSRDHR